MEQQSHEKVEIDFVKRVDKGRITTVKDLELSKCFTVVIRPLSTRLIKSVSVSISHRRSTTVSLETKILFMLESRPVCLQA